MYEYGPKGRRFAKVLTESGATIRTEYLYEGDEPVADFLMKAAGPRLKVRYINGAGIDERLALMQYNDATGSRETFNYYLSNHQGSIIGMMQDGDGLSALTDPYTYDAYGNMRDTEDGNGQPFRYTGRRYDETTGIPLLQRQARPFPADRPHRL